MRAVLSIACASLLLILVGSLLIGHADAKKKKQSKAIGAFGHDAHYHLKCSCCLALTEEIFDKMNETSRLKTSILNSHRLNERNKVRRIDYESSELRAVEILEGLCKSFSSRYELRLNETSGHRVVSKNTTMKPGDFYSRQDREGLDEFQKKLTSFCEFIIDEHDDTLVELIKTKRVLDDLSHGLCHKKANLCSPPAVEKSISAETKLKAAYDARRQREREEEEAYEQKQRNEEAAKKAKEEAEAAAAAAKAEGSETVSGTTTVNLGGEAATEAAAAPSDEAAAPSAETPKSDL